MHIPPLQQYQQQQQHPQQLTQPQSQPIQLSSVPPQQQTQPMALKQPLPQQSQQRQPQPQPLQAQSRVENQAATLRTNSLTHSSTSGPPSYNYDSLDHSEMSSVASSSPASNHLSKKQKMSPSISVSGAMSMPGRVQQSQQSSMHQTLPQSMHQMPSQMAQQLSQQLPQQITSQSYQQPIPSPQQTSVSQQTQSSQQAPTQQQQQQPTQTIPDNMQSAQPAQQSQQQSTQAASGTGQQSPTNQNSQAPGSATQQPRRLPPVRASTWTKAEEDRLRILVELGTKWQAITKEFPNRTAGAIKKHYYADMKHTTWSPEEDTRLAEAVKDDEDTKWKRISEKVGKPAKACERRVKELLKMQTDSSAANSLSQQQPFHHLQLPHSM
ncbi:uncharacterized protein V1516DRAFT_668123 [Lipomyces oligophaga]|uniref:uncharacterized protein n=1 Tax=Lipomyces oligophaga TaxID=45792 RepID=UPI0034CF8641